jgi:hypothetical protein
VSDQNADQTSGEPPATSADSVHRSSEAHTQPSAASAERSSDKVTAIGSPDLLSGQRASADTEATVAPALEAPKAAAPAFPGKVIASSVGDHNRESNSAEPEVESGPNRPMFGKRRLSAVAAVVALATATGALGGALATAGLSRFSSGDVERNDKRAVEASVARIEADMIALKASLEHNSKIGVAQLNKAGDRLDKLEKAQAEPAAKIAKLSEAVDKLRATHAIAPVPVSVPAASKETTGSISQVAVSVAPPKTEVSKLPTLEGWALRDVGNGGALIQSRLGIYEVYAGDAVPGLGRVDAIRRQDGRWVVVTSKGLVVARQGPIASP